MKLYYRADTRSPQEIFETGFSPRDPYAIQVNQKYSPWWSQGINDFQGNLIKKESSLKTTNQ